jgi:hypothetical protein
MGSAGEYIQLLSERMRHRDWIHLICPRPLDRKYVRTKAGIVIGILCIFDNDVFMNFV